MAKRIMVPVAKPGQLLVKWGRPSRGESPDLMFAWGRKARQNPTHVFYHLHSRSAMFSTGKTCGKFCRSVATILRHLNSALSKNDCYPFTIGFRYVPLYGTRKTQRKQ